MREAGRMEILAMHGPGLPPRGLDGSVSYTLHCPAGITPEELIRVGDR